LADGLEVGSGDEDSLAGGGQDEAGGIGGEGTDRGFKTTDQILIQNDDRLPGLLKAENRRARGRSGRLADDGEWFGRHLAKCMPIRVDTRGLRTLRSVISSWGSRPEIPRPDLPTTWQASTFSGD